MNMRMFLGVKLQWWAFIGLIVLLFFTFLGNIAWGSESISVQEIFNVFFKEGSLNTITGKIILKTRLPQAVTALFAGAALSVSGLLLQSLFRNPLAGPSVLGVSSGAGLGVAFVILMVGGFGGIALSTSGIMGNITVTAAAFLGSFAVLGVILILSVKLKDNAMLLIVGIMMSYASSAIIGILKFYSLKEDIQSFVIWGLGSFSNTQWMQLQVFVPVILIGIVGSLLLVKPLNTFWLGENYASNLGINVKHMRFWVLICTGLLTATVTAFCGPVAFLGLAVPHLSKNIFRTSKHGILLPAVILMGAVLALMCNIIARLPGFDGALPINAVTSVIGAPIVISIILKRKRMTGWN